MESPGSWTSLDTWCRLEGTESAVTGLAVLESRRENDCLVKYIFDTQSTSSTRNYAIGLKADSHYLDVYEWVQVDNSSPGAFDSATPNFINWAPGRPQGNPCVYMSVGWTNRANGLWVDGVCSTNLYGICERRRG